MTKKLLKYGKIMMALALIVSLTLPSYATVGAADGSAFVTKAEFDSALADFNARLTTFEAGINSKIDSQVSSYLDRNGIWNGKTQTHSTSLFRAFYYPTALSSNVIGLYPDYSGSSWSWYGGPITSYKYPSSRGFSASDHQNVVSNITKSGLAMIYFDTETTISSSGSFTAMGVGSSQVHNAWSRFSVTLGFNQDTSSTYQTTLNETFGWGYIFGYWGSGYVPKIGPRLVTMFVQSGMPLKMTAIDNSQWSGYGSYSADTSYSTSPAAPSWGSYNRNFMGYKYKFTKVIVY